MQIHVVVGVHLAAFYYSKISRYRRSRPSRCMPLGKHTVHTCTCAGMHVGTRVCTLLRHFIRLPRFPTHPALAHCSGGFIKRDGRPRDSEVLTSRLVDRPLRPMFTKGWANETQVRPTRCSANEAHVRPLHITNAGHTRHRWLAYRRTVACCALTPRWAQGAHPWHAGSGVSHPALCIPPLSSASVGLPVSGVLCEQSVLL